MTEYVSKYSSKDGNGDEVGKIIGAIKLAKDLLIDDRVFNDIIKSYEQFAEECGTGEIIPINYAKLIKSRTNINENTFNRVTRIQLVDIMIVIKHNKINMYNVVSTLKLLAHIERFLKLYIKTFEPILSISSKLTSDIRTSVEDVTNYERGTLGSLVTITVEGTDEKYPFSKVYKKAKIAHPALINFIKYLKTVAANAPKE